MSPDIIIAAKSPMSPTGNKVRLMTKGHNDLLPNLQVGNAEKLLFDGIRNTRKVWMLHDHKCSYRRHRQIKMMSGKGARAQNSPILVSCAFFHARS